VEELRAAVEELRARLDSRACCSSGCTLGEEVRGAMSRLEARLEESERMTRDLEGDLDLLEGESASTAQAVRMLSASFSELREGVRGLRTDTSRSLDALTSQGLMLEHVAMAVGVGTPRLRIPGAAPTPPARGGDGG
jgi:predicted nuclease with TOPRIM domain